MSFVLIFLYFQELNLVPDPDPFCSLQSKDIKMQLHICGNTNYVLEASNLVELKAKISDPEWIIVQDLNHTLLAIDKSVTRSFMHVT